MKKARGNKKNAEMRTEYHFDYSKAKPKRFASRVDDDRVVVALEPDAAEVFTTPESVNEVLRALIHTMPRAGNRKARQ